MLFAMHWSLWIVGILVLLGVVLWRRMTLSAERDAQLKQAGREKWNYDRLINDLKGSHFSLSDQNHEWNALPAEKQQEVINQLPDLLAANAETTSNMAYSMEHLTTGILKDRLPMEEIRLLARTLIEKDPAGLSVLALAQSVWGKGKVPTDLLLLMLKKSNFYEEDIFAEEIRSENKEEIATHFAENEDWGYLEKMFPDGDPSRETFLRKCTECMLQKNPDEADIDGIVHCYAWMKDWTGLLAFVNDEKWKDRISGPDFLSAVEGAPEDIRGQFAAWAASEGWLLGLVKCYNPGIEEGKILNADMLPTDHLKTCLKELKQKMKDDSSGDHWACVAADCAIILKDEDECREIADACIEKGYAATAGKLLCALRRMEKEKATAIPST